MADLEIGPQAPPAISPTPTFPTSPLTGAGGPEQQIEATIRRSFVLLSAIARQKQIQTNTEPNANQNIAVQAFPQTLNIQGLPNGFDKGVGGANPLLASINSN